MFAIGEERYHDRDFGQASFFDVGPSLSIGCKIIRAQLAIVLPLGYTPP